jgi:uncharacterized protein YecE (DUF72 family)
MLTSESLIRRSCRDRKELACFQRKSALMDKRWYVGTQSWLYRQWNNVFFDEGTRPGETLAQYAQEFNAVEVDSSFYGTPPDTTIGKWLRDAPDAFRFSLKMPQVITHEQRFRGCDAEVDRFFAQLQKLGAQSGPALIQLPPDCDSGTWPDLLAALRRRPEGLRCALEFRHTSWFTHALFQEYENAGVAIAAVDAPFIPLTYCRRVIERPTTDFAYVRLLGARDDTMPFDRLIHDRDAELNSWGEVLERAQVGDIFLYTSNYYEGFAPETARRILSRLAVTHTPRVPYRQPTLFTE